MNSVQRLLMLVHLLEGAWAGVDPDLVADVRELRAVCASARRVAIAADDAALDQAGS